MPRISKLKTAELLYHHVDCGHLEGLKIGLSKKGSKYRKHFASLGLSSEETIATALKAVKASPFKTVFVVREKTGEVLYALSQNEDYVEACRKKKPKPDPDPEPPEPQTDCCRLCEIMGGTSCQPLADGSCICFGATRGGSGGGLDDQLETLAF